MIKVIVCEDKQPILKNVIKKIEKFSPELTIVGEATDGISGRQLITKLKPDIVFTDIRMPGKDGLTLIREIRELFPEILFVVISGYDEFEYAKEALQLGVVDYLLKPVSQKAIDQLLTTLVEKVKTNRYTYEEKVITNIIYAPDKVRNCRMNYNSYLILIICYGSYTNFSIDLSNPMRYVDSNRDIYTTIAQYITPKDTIWTIDTNAINEKMYVIGFHKKPIRTLQNKIGQSIEGQNKYNMPLTVVCSNLVKELEYLRLEYQIALEFLKKNLIFGESQVIYVREKTLAKNDNGIYNADMELYLKSFIKSRQKQKFIHAIRQYLNICKKNKTYQSTLEKELKHIVNDMSKILINQDIIFGNVFLEIDEIISKSITYEEIYNNLTLVFEKFFESHKSSSGSGKDLVEYVENYIAKHYSEDININELAEMSNFNVSYLSRSFKKYKGLTPIEYLTSLRIDTAKNFLAENDKMKIKDVAEMVGYSNQYYFCKVFKLITGITPTKYREDYLNKS